MSAADLLGFLYEATDEMYRDVEQYFARTGRSPDRLILTHWWTEGYTMIEWAQKVDDAGSVVDGPVLALWLSVPKQFELKVGVGTTLSLHGTSVPVSVGAPDATAGWHMTPRGRH
jgi:hypothetical protein